MKRTPIKRKTAISNRRRVVPKEIRDHWQRVVKLGCCVTFSDLASIHHVHGGSIREALGKQGMPGIGQKQNPWLVIPLHPRLHYGQDGIDSGTGQDKGVVAWEARHGRQIDYLRKVREQIKVRHGYCIFERAGLHTPDE